MKAIPLHPGDRRRDEPDAALVHRLGAAQGRLPGKRRSRRTGAGLSGRAKVRVQYAFGPTIGSAVNVTLLTYVDTCALGIDVDTGAIPDYDEFLDCLVQGSTRFWPWPTDDDAGARARKGVGPSGSD